MVCYRKICALASEQGWLRHCCHVVLSWVSCCDCCWPATWSLGRLRIVSWLCWNGSDFQTASIIAAISLLVRGALLSVCLITVSVGVSCPFCHQSSCPVWRTGLGWTGLCRAVVLTAKSLIAVKTAARRTAWLPFSILWHQDLLVQYD